MFYNNKWKTTKENKVLFTIDRQEPIYLKPWGFLLRPLVSRYYIVMQLQYCTSVNLRFENDIFMMLPSRSMREMHEGKLFAKEYILLADDWRFETLDR